MYVHVREFEHFVVALYELKRDIRKLKKEVRTLKTKPGRIVNHLISEGQDNMLNYNGDLPAVPADPNKELASQELTVKVDGKPDQAVQVLAMDVTTVDYSVEKNDVTTLSLRYRDDDGNLSLPSDQTFTAKDTIAPDQPGPFGEQRLVSETP